MLIALIDKSLMVLNIQILHTHNILPFLKLSCKEHDFIHYILHGILAGNRNKLMKEEILGVFFTQEGNSDGLTGQTFSSSTCLELQQAVEKFSLSLSLLSLSLSLSLSHTHTHTHTHTRFSYPTVQTCLWGIISV